MGAEEILDWIAYDMTCDPEFREYLNNIPQAFDSAEAEAAAIKQMLMGIQCPK